MGQRVVYGLVLQGSSSSIHTRMHTYTCTHTHIRTHTLTHARTHACMSCVHTELLHKIYISNDYILNMVKGILLSCTPAEEYSVWL